MSNALIAVDAGIALLEFMLERNLAIEKFNAELKQMRSEGKETFTIEDLQRRQDELKGRIDNL